MVVVFGSPENIHTPPQRELEIPKGWGSEAQEIPGGKGGWTITITFQGVYQSGRSFLKK